MTHTGEQRVEQRRHTIREIGLLSYGLCPMIAMGEAQARFWVGLVILAIVSLFRGEWLGRVVFLCLFRSLDPIIWLVEMTAGDGQCRLAGRRRPVHDPDLPG